MSLKTATLIALLSQIVSWVLRILPYLYFIKAGLFSQIYFIVTNTINIGGPALFFAVLYFKQKNE